MAVLGHLCVEQGSRCYLSAMTRQGRLTAFVLAACLLSPAAPCPPLTAQATGGPSSETQVRVGILFGGTSLLGFVSEYRRGDWSGELIVGTFGPFRSVFSAALTAKRYFSGGNLRPVVGGGLWGVAVWGDEGAGSLLTLRFPAALDWNFRGNHALGFEVGLNRAVAVNRVDPTDDAPASSRIVPFPGAYYRYGWTP